MISLKAASFQPSYAENLPEIHDVEVIGAKRREAGGGAVLPLKHAANITRSFTSIGITTHCVTVD